MTLLEFQRRMTADVCRPLTSDFAMQIQTGDGEPLESLANSYVAPNKMLSSFERLEIYNQQYWLRAISAVAEDFPALQAVIGKKRFDALVLAYLRETPSASWNLRDLSANLPDFLGRHSELTGRRHRLAVDVARLEWAYMEAFDGGQQPALTIQQIQTIGPDSRLGLQPHLRLLALEFPVDDLVLAIHRGLPESEVVSNAASGQRSVRRASLPLVKRNPTFLAVHRFENSVYYRRIEREWLLMFEALRQGSSLGQALETAFVKTKRTPEEQATIIQNCFAVAAELGWFV